MPREYVSPLEVPWDELLELVEEAAANGDRRAQFSLPKLLEHEQRNRAAGLPPDHETVIHRLSCMPILNPDRRRSRQEDQ